MTIFGVAHGGDMRIRRAIYSTISIGEAWRSPFFRLLSISIIHYSCVMIRDWIDARDAVAFAQEIVRDIDLLFPLVPQIRKPASIKKDQKKLDAIVLRTRAFAQQHKLNFYKKAKLLNTIKWQMRGTGHDDALINEIISLLTPLLN
jgi:hypothetical protein